MAFCRRVLRSLRVMRPAPSATVWRGGCLLRYYAACLNPKLPMLDALRLAVQECGYDDLLVDGTVAVWATNLSSNGVHVLGDLQEPSAHDVLKKSGVKNLKLCQNVLQQAFPIQEPKVDKAAVDAQTEYWQNVEDELGRMRAAGEWKEMVPRLLMTPNPKSGSSTLTPLPKPTRWRETQRATMREYAPVRHTFTPTSFGIQQYDYSKPTSEVYASSKAEFAPKYEEVRRLLDYSWHPHYTLQRQLFQDHLVDKVFANASAGRPARPWILFTAGPMGVGKGYVMQYFEREGLLNLQDWVQSLPDWFREQLPEYPGYLAYNHAKAGLQTQQEAGLLAEIVVHEALRRGSNLVVDGSLRDVEYYHGYLQSLRHAFPHYRIAIIYVAAEVEKVKERARLRARRTGRRIPDDVLLKCIEDVPKSVARLAPLVDFVCEVDNSGERPVLTSTGLCKGGGCSFDTFPAELRLSAGTPKPPGLTT